MRYLHLLFLLAVLSCKSTDGNDRKMPIVASPTPLSETERFVFYSPFWLNMHHFLHHQVLHRDTNRVDVFEKSLMDQLSATAMDSIRKVVDYYQEEMIEQDLRTSDYMEAFKAWSGQQSEVGLNAVPDSFRQHADHLLAFAPIYRQYFWPKHQSANQKILSDNISLIQKLEIPISHQLEKWTGADWQTDKIRVDITYYAKSYRNYGRDRPFTTLHPTHVVMNVTGHDVPGNWFELLFHETSHHLITPSTGFVSETLQEAAAALNLAVPRNLWHAYLFYFSGKACQQLLQDEGLKDYELYMIRNRVFGEHIPYLEQFLPPYLEGNTSLLQASTNLIRSLAEDQK